ncbi:type IV pili twitching motility protein PilT [Tumebacillus algifaecis]|uniref:Type IV pili twitching motility protein PilT n=1 Tax=Tumebacillus algifaecis TaxID=1214604 RepID=A0A223D0D9_9BACL|nr:PilT/PilU family type 4a pilus ATPase [Tumebacillus algifaecis]ASS74935.1 type IV pili twitching motility protein PilT [Tumebacillus algifaecis]
MKIGEHLHLAVTMGASDLHLTVGAPPMFRVDGELRPLAGRERLSAEDTYVFVHELVSQQMLENLMARGECDFSYEMSEGQRFRMQVFKRRGALALAIRVIPKRVPSAAEIGLSADLLSFVERRQGLFLVTGPTGSGKSTTLACLLAEINRRYRRRIITLEDPIEYLHEHEQSLIDQREVGRDTLSFAEGLRAALRQDPDVIMVGEMRDLETVATAITAAETGHLVLATLHTSDAPQTIDRILDVFPAEGQRQIRTQLASVLLGIVSQRLVPSARGKGRTAVQEILVNTPAVANLIRTEKAHQLRTAMQTGKAHGMQTFEMHIQELLSNGAIKKETVHAYLQDLQG